LKNHALLLFGPSPFELWFKSCKFFSVRSLLFSDFASQSLVQFIPLLLPGATAPLLCSWRPAAGAVRRSWSPPATLCSPSPRVIPLPVHRFSPLPCWRPGRAPRRFAVLQRHRRHLCRRRTSVVHPPRSARRPKPGSSCLSFSPCLPIKAALRPPRAGTESLPPPLAPP
jgi:hypothetical protein